uniref:Dolichol-phosphate mannosyltransferase subunit 3 n=1 Tax=Anopheles darlingi TaxID=43151 RepID=A0A2M4CQE9_ANODA
MTKLFEWLMAAACFLSVYFAIVLRQVKHELLDQYMLEIQLSPIFLLILFGVSKPGFNNCEEAAKELMEQIKEAKADTKTIETGNDVN